MIITQIEQLRRVIPNLDANIELDTFQTYIETTEKWLKNELLGTALYDKVDTGSPSDSLKTVSENIVSLRAYLEAIPFLDVVLTNNGLAIVSTQQLAPASKERKNNLINALQKRLDQEIEKLINYLYTSDDYSTWKDSQPFDRIFSVLLYSATDFSNYIELYQNRDVYKRIKPNIKVAQQEAGNYVSVDYINELVQKQKDQELTSHDNEVLTEIKHAVALLSVARSLEKQVIQLSGGAFVAPSNYDIIQPKIINDYTNIARSLLDKAATYMDNNIDNYSTYADSDVYEQKTADETPGWSNSEDDSIFVGP